jgi:hypothetical protein
MGKNATIMEKMQPEWKKCNLNGKNATLMEKMQP